MFDESEVERFARAKAHADLRAAVPSKEVVVRAFLNHERDGVLHPEVGDARALVSAGEVFLDRSHDANENRNQKQSHFNILSKINFYVPVPRSDLL